VAVIERVARLLAVDFYSDSYSKGGQIGQRERGKALCLFGLETAVKNNQLRQSYSAGIALDA
jgi:hypothetical protein